MSPSPENECSRVRLISYRVAEFVLATNLDAKRF
jgi:hypothetical protein